MQTHVEQSSFLLQVEEHGTRYQNGMSSNYIIHWRANLCINGQLTEEEV